MSTCFLCERRLATNDDLGTMPPGEDGGLCWRDYGSDTCIAEGEANVIRKLRSDNGRLRDALSRINDGRHGTLSTTEMALIAWGALGSKP